MSCTCSLPLIGLELTRREIPFPHDLWESEAEKADPLLQRQKLQAYTELQQQSGVLTLLEDPVAHQLIILGSVKAVERAGLLILLHFKHQSQIKALQQQKQKLVASLEEEKKRLQSGYIEEFTVSKSLIGLVIGKSGANIRAAEKSPGVQSIKIHSDSAQITIVAKDKESALAARRMLEFVQETFSVPRRLVFRFVGMGYAHIREIESNAKVTRIRISDGHVHERDAESKSFERGRGRGRGVRGGRGGMMSGRGVREDDANEDAVLEVIGTLEAVGNALLLLSHHLKYVIAAQELQNEGDQVNAQLVELNKSYGIHRPYRGNNDDASFAGRRRGGVSTRGGVSARGRRDAADTDAEPSRAEVKANGGAFPRAAAADVVVVPEAAAAPSGDAAGRKKRNDRRGGRREKNKDEAYAPAEESAARGAADSQSQSTKGASDLHACAAWPSLLLLLLWWCVGFFFPLSFLLLFLSFTTFLILFLSFFLSEWQDHGLLLLLQMTKTRRCSWRLNES